MGGCQENSNYDGLRVHVQADYVTISLMMS